MTFISTARNVARGCGSSIGKTVSASLALVLITLPVLANSAGDADPAQFSEWVGPDVGDVVRKRGELVTRSGALRTSIGAGDDITFGSRLLTGERTRAEVELVDGSRLFLGDHSEIVVDEFVYDPGRKSRGTLTLLKGAIRMVSGRINKVSDGSLALNTPVATIGIRGTDFWGLQEPNKLTLALIDNGELHVMTEQGEVVLSEPLTAVVIERGKAPSQVIRLTPAQFQAAAQTVSWRGLEAPSPPALLGGRD